MYFGYLILINLLCLVSAAVKTQDEKQTENDNFIAEDEASPKIDENITFEEEEKPIRNNVALVISYHKKLYRFPFKASITEDQKQEFYYSDEKDGQYYCPIEDAENGNAPIDDPKYEYCLVQTAFEKQQDKKCKKEVKPIIVEKTDDQGNPENCGTETRILYKFGYQICVKKSMMKSFFAFGEKTTMRDFFEDIQYPHTYEICYDHAENRIIYSKHSIMSSYILRNLRLEKEKALHDFSEKFSTETYGLENLRKLERILRAYRKQEIPEGTNQREYELQMLVPMIDFALGHWILTTYHLINYSPQHKTRLFIWEVINQYVNYKIVRLDKNPDILIYNGTWGIRLDKNDDKIYLGNDGKRKVTIPQIWWKIIHNLEKNKATVIILHNEDNLKRICKRRKDACDIVNWRYDLQPWKEWISGNAYCCDVASAKSTITTIDDLGISEVDDILELN